MTHGPHLNPYQRFLRSVLVTLLSIAKMVEGSVTWFLTGIAAVTALLIANIESVTKLVSLGPLKFGLGCFIFSMIAGVFARATAIGITTRLEINEEMNKYFASAEAKTDMAGMNEMKVESHQILEDLASCIGWPTSLAFRRGAKRSDPLDPERGCAKSLNTLILLIIIQQISAFVGLIAILCGM